MELYIEVELLASEEAFDVLLLACEFRLDDGTVKKIMFSWCSAKISRDLGIGGKFTSITPQEFEQPDPLKACEFRHLECTNKQLYKLW